MPMFAKFGEMSGVGVTHEVTRKLIVELTP